MLTFWIATFRISYFFFPYLPHLLLQALSTFQEFSQCSLKHTILPVSLSHRPSKTENFRNWSQPTLNSQLFIFLTDLNYFAEHSVILFLFIILLHGQRINRRFLDYVSHHQSLEKNINVFLCMDNFGNIESYKSGPKKEFGFLILHYSQTWEMCLISIQRPILSLCIIHYTQCIIPMLLSLFHWFLCLHCCF